MNKDWFKRSKIDSEKGIILSPITYKSYDDMVFRNNMYYDLSEEQDEMDDKRLEDSMLTNILVTVSTLTSHTKMIVWYSYLQADITQRDLAKKLGISYNRLRYILHDVNTSICNHYGISKKTLKTVFHKPKTP